MADAVILQLGRVVEAAVPLVAADHRDGVRVREDGPQHHAIVAVGIQQDRHVLSDVGQPVILVAQALPSQHRQPVRAEVVQVGQAHPHPHRLFVDGRHGAELQRWCRFFEGLVHFFPFAAVISTTFTWPSFMP